VIPDAYGADPTGATDSTAALKLALSAGDVCFPAGSTYLLDSPPITISTDNKHLQAATVNLKGVSGPPAVIKHTNTTTGHELFVLSSPTGTSIIGLDFESTNIAPAQWNNYPQGWDIPIYALGNSIADTLIAGNTFNAWWGQAEVEFYADPCNSGAGNVIEYNTFKNCGLYGPVVDGFQNVSIHDNSMTDCSDGQENDNSGQCAGNVWNHETLLTIYGDGYQSTGQPTLLTGGKVGYNDSGNIVENSSVSGPGSSLCQKNRGSAPARYSNNTCVSGCRID
jgi:hypothetical protein